MSSLSSFVALLVLALSANSIASPIDNMLPPRLTPAPTTTTAAADFVTLNISTPTTPGRNCTTTLFEGGKFGPLQQPTCTFYQSYTTVTEYVDCGGCVLEKLGLGPGPVVRCGTNVQSPLGTETVTTCSPTNTPAPTPASPTPTPECGLDDEKEMEG
ncbi:hypothetical protein B0J12DRAFT_111592 [Macrophomina phaseolina]|uniref:Uncharacterized protein n=1 Tax=Macrophomina phaseolina TaxID=35725 RepID=A0ABQ8G8M1_9PEZI|nr:hypothetical protein B0J12DRAFT_111592 [Macrophomina phaseolina]